MNSEAQARKENAKEWAESLSMAEIEHLLDDGRQHLRSLGQFCYSAIIFEWKKRDSLKRHAYPHRH